jgi:hypothetical protein
MDGTTQSVGMPAGGGLPGEAILVVDRADGEYVTVGRQQTAEEQ